MQELTGLVASLGLREHLLQGAFLAFGSCWHLLASGSILPISASVSLFSLLKGH